MRVVVAVFVRAFDLSCLKKITSKSSTCYTSGLNAVLDRHVDLFRDELGLVKGVKATLSVDKTATPRFFRARSVPFALRDRVEAELDKLVKEGMLHASGSVLRLGSTDCPGD